MTFPGGFVDLGESVQEAVLRETDEELGLPIELRSLVGVTRALRNGWC